MHWRKHSAQSNAALAQRAHRQHLLEPVPAQSLHSHRQESTSSRKPCLGSSPGLCRPVTERPWCSTFNFDGSSSSLSPLQKKKKERTPELQKMSKLHGILMKNFACHPNKHNSALTRKVATVAEEWALWTAPSLKQPFDRWGPASFRVWEGSRRQEESRNTPSIHSRKRRKHPNTTHAAREHLYFGTTHVEMM